MQFRKILTAFALSTAISGASAVSFAPTAWALDPDAFLEKLESGLASSDTELEFEKSSIEGDTIILDGVTVSNAGEDWEMKIGQATLGGIEERSGGETFVGFLNLKDIVQTSDDGDEFRLSASELKSAGLLLGNTSKAPVSSLSSATLTEVELSGKGNKARFIAKTPQLSVTDFDFDNENKFTIGSFQLQPVSASSGGDDQPFLVNFEGFSFSDFERLSALGVKVGALDIGKLSFTGQSNQGQALEAKFAGAQAINIIYPDLTDPNQKLVGDKTTDIKIDSFSFTLDGQDLLGWGKYISTYGPAQTANSIAGDGSFNDLYINLDALPVDNNAQRKNIERIKSIGYERIEIDVYVDMAWDLDTGVMDLKKTRFDFTDAGAIEASVKLGGYTEQLIRTVGDISNRMNAETDPKKREAMSVQVLAAMAGLSVQSLAVSVEDASLLGKVLKLQAEQTGRQPEEIAAIAGPLVAVTLAPFQVPEFASSVTNALNTFMQGNKKITASADPQGGLAVTEIIALASGTQAGTVTPAELIDRLKLQVTAE